MSPIFQENDTQCPSIFAMMQRIVDNVERFGLARYDRIDVKFYPPLLEIGKRSKIGRFFRNIVLVIDEILPLLIRRILKSKKTISPTTFSFLIAAYSIIEINNYPVRKKETSIALMQQCIDTFVEDDGDNCWWDLPIEPYLKVALGQEKKRRTMHIHGLARCNLQLIYMYRRTNEGRYLELSHRSLKTAISHHNIVRFRDGSASISYYPYTMDCTLNICSEFCQWLSMIPSDLRDEDQKALLVDMTELLINEQLPCGGFRYYGKQNELSIDSENTIDCHHSATVLANLLGIINEKVLQNTQQDKLISAVNRGFEYFIDTFIDEETGRVIDPRFKSRPAGPTQYGETVLALCAFLKNASSDSDLKSRVAIMLPKIVSRMSRLVYKDGSCPSEKVLFWQHLNSIRWGNGVILNALASYMTVK